MYSQIWCDCCFFLRNNLCFNAFKACYDICEFFLLTLGKYIILLDLENLFFHIRFKTIYLLLSEDRMKTCKWIGPCFVLDQRTEPDFVWWSPGSFLTLPSHIILTGSKLVISLILILCVYRRSSVYQFSKLCFDQLVIISMTTNIQKMSMLLQDHRDSKETLTK